MSRHLDNLERLCQKLQFRFGTDDALFLQIRREFETRVSEKPKEVKRQEWSVPYRMLVKHRDASARYQSRC